MSVERSARIMLDAARREATRVKYRATSRVDRLRANGAPLATLREETYRACGADRRRATVRENGTIPLPGDPDYKGRRFAVCLFPLPSAPGTLRIAGKVAAPCVDSARAEEKVSRAINVCDARANALHASRVNAEREIVSLVRAHARATGAKRKALTFKIRAMIHNGDASIAHAARVEGWRV